MADTAATVLPSHPRQHEHVVGFYETDAYLAESVATFLLPAFESDGTAIVIATPEHRTQVADALSRGASTPHRRSTTSPSTLPPPWNPSCATDRWTRGGSTRSSAS